MNTAGSQLEAGWGEPIWFAAMTMGQSGERSFLQVSGFCYLTLVAISSSFFLAWAVNCQQLLAVIHYPSSPLLVWLVSASVNGYHNMVSMVIVHGIMVSNVNGI